jgi:two-component system sensor histidine kinase/response regulator
MNYKELSIPDKMNTVEKIAYHPGKTQKSMLVSGVVADKDRHSQNYLSFRIKELQKLNASLENLVEQHSQELARVVKTNTKFLSIIAHDLRSPFSTILGVLELLKVSLDENNKNEIEEFMEVACNSANRTLNLLDNLLVWAISQNKGKSFKPEKINFFELVVEEFESISFTARQKQIVLNHTIEPNLYINADLQMVKTILRNLIYNAVKYTNTGDKITLSALEDKHYVEITVKDNGIGISTDAQRNLFKIDSFHSSAGTNNEPGTGFGLLLCIEFVEMHGGNIWIESEPGKGSEFKFTLPHYI